MESKFNELFSEADKLRNDAKVKEAVSAYVEIFKLAKEDSDLPAQARALHMAGVSSKEAVLDIRGTAYRDAITFYKEAAKLYRQAKNQAGLGALYRDVAITSDYGKDFHNAEVYFQKSIETLQKVEEAVSDLAISYDKWGLHYYKKGDYQTAIEKIEIAEQIFRRDPTNGFYIATTLFDQARVLFKMLDYEKALQTALESLSWFEADHGDVKYLRRKAQLNSLLFVIYAQLNNDDEAKRCWNKYQELIKGFDPQAVGVLQSDLKELTNENHDYLRIKPPMSLDFARDGELVEPKSGDHH